MLSLGYLWYLQDFLVSLPLCSRYSCASCLVSSISALLPYTKLCLLLECHTYIGCTPVTWAATSRVSHTKLNYLPRNIQNVCTSQETGHCAETCECPSLWKQAIHRAIQQGSAGSPPPIVPRDSLERTEGCTAGLCQQHAPGHVQELRGSCHLLFGNVCIF